MFNPVSHLLQNIELRVQTSGTHPTYACACGVVPVEILRRLTSFGDNIRITSIYRVTFVRLVYGSVPSLTDVDRRV